MKKLISLMLVLIMVFTFTGTSLATIEDGPSDGAIKYSDVSEQINGEKITKLDNTEYYMDYTDNYNIIIGKLSNGNLDIAYYDKVNDLLYHSFIKNEHTKLAKNDFYIKIKSDILNQELKLETIDQSAFTSNVVLSRSSPGEYIWAELLRKGWKDPQTTVIMRETRNGNNGELELSTSYSFVERINIFTGAIGATAGLIAARLGLDPNLALSIGVFVWSAVQNAYVLLFDQNFEEYNVFAYENKFVYVNNSYQYRAGRTVKWIAACGDEGTTFKYKSDKSVYDFYDNTSLMNTGFYNYLNY